MPVDQLQHMSALVMGQHSPVASWQRWWATVLLQLRDNTQNVN
jgi:hypothetical protein